MKRYGHLHEKIISKENCKLAIINASKHKKNRRQVRKILENIDFYAEDLSARLVNLKFTSPYTKKVIKDGLSGKEREIQVPKFYPDQCAHHAIVQVLRPIILKSSYHWSCANIPNRGIKQACIGVERATVRDQRHAKYCAKMDIKKFYPSIPHDKLIECFKRKIKDRNVIALIEVLVFTHSEGLPIGNYTSPWFAEFFLQPLDRLIKQKYNVRYYVRYADDLVLIDNNKKRLRSTLYAIKSYLSLLGMELKHDYQVFKIYQNGKGRKIDFVGRCFGKGFCTIRKRRALAFMRQSRKIQKLQAQGKPIPFRVASGFVSRSACLQHTNSKGLKHKYYDTINLHNLKQAIRKGA